jgi:hypothetical protein
MNILSLTICPDEAASRLRVDSADTASSLHRVIGEILADLAIKGETRHPVGFLGLNRFEY